MASDQLRVTPPCKLLVDPKPQWQQTYVVLGDHKAEAAFNAFASAQAVNGAGMWATHQTRNETYLVITLGKAGCEKSKIREIKEGPYMLPGTGGIEWVRPFTRRFQCLFGWDATVVEKACAQNDTQKLAKLIPGAHAVDPALLPAIAQLGNEPKLLMIEDCPHWMWWDQRKELHYEAKIWTTSLRTVPATRPPLLPMGGGTLCEHGDGGVPA